MVWWDRTYLQPYTISDPLPSFFFIFPQYQRVINNDFSEYSVSLNSLAEVRGLCLRCGGTLGEAEAEGLKVVASVGNLVRTCPKIKFQKGCRCSSEVKYLPSMCKTLACARLPASNISNYT